MSSKKVAKRFYWRVSTNGEGVEKTVGPCPSVESCLEEARLDSGSHSWARQGADHNLRAEIFVGTERSDRCPKAAVDHNGFACTVASKIREEVGEELGLDEELRTTLWARTKALKALRTFLASWCPSYVRLEDPTLDLKGAKKYTVVLPPRWVVTLHKALGEMEQDRQASNEIKALLAQAIAFSSQR